MTRVRFAPSPTGNLHIGSLRTALFNWLYARNQKGTYILRIEDTDLARSKKEFEKNILDGLEWAGLDMDEGPGIDAEYGPYYQSERIENGLYEDYMKKLLDSGSAYYCFCTAEDLDKERAAAKANTENYVYSRKCCELLQEEIQNKISQNQPYSVRFRMPADSQLSYKDLIRDEISFDLSLISDFVIMKSDGSASYNFAVVVDDMLMKITHVIRGEDHISNTPKQICIYKAFGVKPPEFAHLPMILGPDRSKLSKRHGATSIVEYQEQGFLKEAVFNYLVLLGWSPKDNREILTKEEIIRDFCLENVSKSGAIFDTTKLKWMNGQYIRKLESQDYINRVTPFINESILAALPNEEINDSLLSVQNKLEVLTDINSQLKVFSLTFDEYKAEVKEHEFTEENQTVFKLFQTKLETLELTDETLHKIIDDIQSETGYGKGKIMKPLRLGLTGMNMGPDLSKILISLGKDVLAKRLKNVIK